MVSDISEQLRAAVAERAGHRCEYCHLPARTQVGRFPIDHVLPRTAGGATTLENLAFACFACNAHKWAAVDAVDPQSGLRAPLFNPRTQFWPDHFRWSDSQLGSLIGLTPVGRATVDCLAINAPAAITVRSLLAQLAISFD